MLDRPAKPTQPPAAAEPTLADVLNLLEPQIGRSPTRLRDLRSAVNRVAALHGEEPVRIKLDLPAISAKLAAVNPVGSGLSVKSFSNLRSDFLAAIKASGLMPSSRKAKRQPGPEWIALLAQLPGKRQRIGLSRLARFASAGAIAPPMVDDTVIASFMEEVRKASLHRKPNDLHRSVTTIWNEVAGLPGLALNRVTVPSFRAAARRTDWLRLPGSFRKDVDEHLDWCSGSNAFDENARDRPLAPQSLRLRRDQIHAAVTALVESGIRPATIESLADLITPDRLRRILRRRLEAKGGKASMFDRDLGKALVQIARELLKVDKTIIAELNRLVAKVEVPVSGLTAKNKKFLRQFDDPAVLTRLLLLPDRLWTEVKREAKPNEKTLAKAQVALAVAILPYMPIRIQNLSALAFDTHLFVRSEAGSISCLELDGGEVKNETEIAFDIPPPVVKMLIDYRDRIAPKIIGHRPQRLFVNVDGTPKHQKTLSDLIKRYVRKRAGIALTPHQFRHLVAKLLLDAEPGSFELVKQVLGHKNLKTTVGSYAGIDARRAGRHHAKLIDQVRQAQRTPLRRRRRRKPDPSRDGEGD